MSSNSPSSPYPQDRPHDEGQTREVPEVPVAPLYAQPRQQAYPAYEPPQYQQPYAPPVPDGHITFRPVGPTVQHPQATLAFVLGLLGVLGLFILGPFGWYVGRKVAREIDADPREFSNRGLASVGKVLGIISTAVLVLFVLLIGVMVVAVVLGTT